jgi:PAS domain S-box-containing protein
MVQFYVQLYACVWDNLEPFFGATTTLELLTLSRQTLQDAYPFLRRLLWTPYGLQRESIRSAVALEEPSHIQAGCEQLLQGIQHLVQELGGDMLAQRLSTATEHLRLAFAPALSTPTVEADLERASSVLPPQDVALPLLRSMGQQALTLYRRVQAQQAALEQAQQELRQGTAIIPPATAADTVTTPAELARSEAFYHSLFDLSPDGVMVTTMAGMIVQANARAAAILEFDTPRDLIGRNAAEFYVRPGERDVLLEQIAQYGYMDTYRREMRTRHAKTIITMASTRRLDYDGRSCLLSVLRDVTERARLRQEMEDFAYSASHDLQAPLRTFEGYARWLLEDYGTVLDETGRQLCEEIIADALHMKKLLDGLLEYSRIGRIHTQPVAVEVRKVLAQVQHDLQLEIVDTGATITVPESLPTVFYPEVRLTQIFSNLLSNALKFATTAPCIRIGCEELARHYRFSVQDNGIGIAPEHFGRIFEIFKRLHTREEYPGTGVGLTIVKKIVEAHGGQIGVESTPGAGSTFWFTVPKTEEAPCAS